MERVIFRKEYNPVTKSWGYLAAFPDDESARGSIAVSPFGFKPDGTAEFEPYTEVSLSYYFKNKIIRRHDPVANKLRAAIQDHYKTTFRVCEKI